MYIRNQSKSEAFWLVSHAKKPPLALRLERMHTRAAREIELYGTWVLLVGERIAVIGTDGICWVGNWRPMLRTCRVSVVD